MIDSSNNVGSLVAGLPAERRPEPVEQPAPARDASSLPQERVVAPSPEVEQLLQAREDEGNRGDGIQQGVSGLRVRRAMAAYSTTQYIEEREYVARLLGVDVRV